MKFISAILLYQIASITSLFAFAPPAGADGQQSPFSMIFLLGSIFLIFYFFVIRPQQKRVKKHKAMVTQLKKGDDVVLSSGIFGKINKTFSDEKRYVHIEIGDKNIIKVLRDSITEVIGKDEPAADTSKKTPLAKKLTNKIKPTNEAVPEDTAPKDAAPVESADKVEEKKQEKKPEKKQTPPKKNTPRSRKPKTTEK